jgi:4-hydroxy-tetrahydrodipicolinate synthase
MDGKFEEARRLHYLLIPFIDSLFMDGSPGGIKAALDQMKIVQNNLRLPVVKVNKSVQNTISGLITDLRDNGIES